VLSFLYLLGLGHVRKRGIPLKARQIVAFFSAIIMVALVLLTPLDTIARTQLFLVHMAQAVILTTVCAPLILAGCSEELLSPLVELPLVRDIVRVLTRPLVASVLFNLTFLLWHTPRIYDLVLTNETVYHVQMLSIFLTSLLNWYPLIGSVRELQRMSYPMQMLYAFFDGQPVDIFAFVLVFTGVPIYAHSMIPAQLGISAFADQAIGGALLLIPGLVDLGVMSPLFFRWLGEIEQRTKLADQKRQQALEEDEWEEEVLEESSSEQVQGVI
jgi:putative membrane protein